MQWKNTTTRYGIIAKTFHWIIALLIICMLIYGYFLGDIPKVDRGFYVNIHKLIGLTILCLMLLRLCWTLMNVKPVLPFGTKPWEYVAERTVHYLIYISAIGMPLSGWIASSAAGKAPHLGSWVFAFPVEKNKQIMSIAFSFHVWLALILIGLISIHALAAFFHYFFKKDDVLQRMM